MTPFRPLLGKLDRPYYYYNREERHLAAMLFHILNLPGKRNIKQLLKLGGCEDWRINDSEFGIYFEFSYLRDLWHAIGDNNDLKRRVIVGCLQAKSVSSVLVESLSKLTVREFNSRFIVGRVSSESIQSPANWQLPVFLKWAIDRRRENPEDVTAICYVKWAFRAKPDLVVQPDLNSALCLELKLGSREGMYPAAPAERKLLGDLFGPRKTRRPFPVSQTAIQRFQMTELLGFRSRHLLVTRSGTPSTDIAAEEAGTVVSWGKLMSELDLGGLPIFMKEGLKFMNS